MTESSYSVKYKTISAGKHPHLLYMPITCLPVFRYPFPAIRLPFFAIRYPFFAIRYPLSAIRYPITATRYSLAPPEPEAKEHAVK